MGDINIDLSSNHHSISKNDYLNTIKNDGFSSLITNPTLTNPTQLQRRKPLLIVL